MIGNLYKTAKWKRIRLEVLERDGYRCRNCKRRGRLHIHHRIPLPNRGKNLPAPIVEAIGFNKSNLISLCRECHNAEHDRHGPEEERCFRAYIRELLAEKENQNDQVAETPNRTKRNTGKGKLVTC